MIPDVKPPPHTLDNGDRKDELGHEAQWRIHTEPSYPKWIHRVHPLSDTAYKAACPLPGEDMTPAPVGQGPALTDSARRQFLWVRGSSPQGPAREFHDPQN